MRIKFYMLVVVIACFFVDCAQLKKQMEEQQRKIASRGTGLTRSSFGALNTQRGSTFVSLCQKSIQQVTSNIVTVNGQSAPPLQNDAIGQFSQNLANKIVDMTPMKGISDAIGKVGDETLEKEDLDHFFTYYRGEKYPHVRLIRRNEDLIDFWFDGTYLRFNESDKAASEFCSHWQKKAVFAGYLEKCGEDHMLPVKVNGQNVYVTDSDVIVAYDCIGDNPKESSQNVQPKKHSGHKKHH